MKRATTIRLPEAEVEATRELVIAGYKRIAGYQINEALERIEVLVLLHARHKWPPA